jgi:GTP-binding protein
MAFVDEMKVSVRAGKGGNGVVRWLNMKGLEMAGPAGGDGGRGGDVVFEGVRDLGILASYRFTKSFNAEHGGSGGSSSLKGRDGEDKVVKVPVGSIIKKRGTGEEFEVLKEGERIVIAKGGSGGYGNEHFKGSTNQNPFQTTPGKPGEGAEVEITLKLIADAGLIGLPNAGKSSLLNELTRAQSKVGSYPFTTLDPHLGDLYGFVLADIPGLIEGASEGRGLGDKFLRHIERTKTLVHLVSVENEDIVSAYNTIVEELRAYSPKLVEKKQIVVLSKIDMVDEETAAKKKQELEGASKSDVLTLTVLDDASIKNFQDTLTSILRTEA